MGYYYRGFDLNNPSDIHPDDIARTQRIVQADGGNPDDFVQVLNVLNFGSHLGRRPDGSFSNPPFVARVRMADGYRRPPEPTPEQQNNPTPAGSPPPIPPPRRALKHPHPPLPHLLEHCRGQLRHSRRRVPTRVVQRVQ